MAVVSKRNKIRKRIRAKVSGTSSRPRLSVFRSNKEIYAQIIDDEAGRTLTAASSKDLGSDLNSLTKVDQAKKVGTAVAEAALKIGVDTISFDRGGYLYHGRVKALADAAREAGLKF